MVVYKNISTFIKEYKNEVVMFCVANNGINEMTLNLVKSCTRNNEEIIVFALDKEVSKYFEKHCPVVEYFAEMGGNGKYNYGSDEFRIIAWHRYFIINELLKNERKIIYLDTDIVINKKFSENVLNELKNCECAIQTNGKNCCTGFFAMKPTKNTKNYFIIDNLKKNNYLSFLTDQDYFNVEIYDKKKFDIKLLDITKYPNGKYFYDNTNKIKDTCYLIHFNNVVGYQPKVDKMKKYNKWAI